MNQGPVTPFRLNFIAAELDRSNSTLIFPQECYTAEKNIEAYLYNVFLINPAI